MSLLPSMLEKDSPYYSKPLLEWQKGWLAGMFDGEGSISISLRALDARGLPKVAVTVAMVHEPTIRAIANLLGVGTVTKEGKQHKKPIWRWRTYVKEYMYIILLALSPYILTKTEQVHLTIKYLKRRLAHLPLDDALVKQMQRMNK